MQKYVRQLIGDLQAACCPEEPEPAPDLNPALSLSEEFNAIEAWIEDDGPHERISGLLQLEPIQFPPPERLNRRQLRMICEAFEATLWSYHITFDIPARLPWKTRYQLLVETLTREVILLKRGMVTIEFCEYEPATCRFGRRYCTCKDLLLSDAKRVLSAAAQALVQHIHLALDRRPEGQQFQIWEHPAEEEPDLDILGKPIAEWLGIEIKKIPSNDGWTYDDTLGITEAIEDVFPGQDWLWTIDAQPVECYDTAVGLLRVQATYDQQGGFHTTLEQMAFFRGMAEFYSVQRRKRGEEDWPF